MKLLKTIICRLTHFWAYDWEDHKTRICNKCKREWQDLEMPEFY